MYCIVRMNICMYCMYIYLVLCNSHRLCTVDSAVLCVCICMYVSTYTPAVYLLLVLSADLSSSVLAGDPAVDEGEALQVVHHHS